MKKKIRKISKAKHTREKCDYMYDMDVFAGEYTQGKSKGVEILLASLTCQKKIQISYELIERLKELKGAKIKIIVLSIKD